MDSSKQNTEPTRYEVYVNEDPEGSYILYTDYLSLQESFIALAQLGESSYREPYAEALHEVVRLETRINRFSEILRQISETSDLGVISRLVNLALEEGERGA